MADDQDGAAGGGVIEDDFRGGGIFHGPGRERRPGETWPATDALGDDPGYHADQLAQLL